MSTDIIGHDNDEKSNNGLLERGEGDSQGELEFEDNACAGTHVDLAELTPRLQEVMLALEDAGFKCDSRKDTVTGDLFIVSPMLDGDSPSDGKPIRIYSTGQCLNLLMLTFKVIDSSGFLGITRIGAEADVFISEQNLLTDSITEAYEAIIAFGICDLDGIPCQVLVHNEFMPVPIDRERVVACLKTYMKSASTMCKAFMSTFRVMMNDDE